MVGDLVQLEEHVVQDGLEVSDAVVRRLRQVPHEVGHLVRGVDGQGQLVQHVQGRRGRLDAQNDLLQRRWPTAAGPPPPPTQKHPQHRPALHLYPDIWVVADALPW